VKRTFVVLAALLSLLSTVPAHAAGSWTWPVMGAVIQGFDPPDSPFGAGHRGIDVAAPAGTLVRAPAAGLVSFAGSVGGRLFVSIDHGGSLVSTCSFLSALLVHKGDLVVEGQGIALSGTGHLGDTTPNVHLGVRVNGEYVDPLGYLSPASVVDLIRLVPIASSAG
jgi:murein DD-endopeptidase MepM/ murein hydrolase activator NlpD